MRKTPKTQTCYMCNSIATSNEHAPPKSFFPKSADNSFKKELITVPSCKSHNQDTSSTDELMMHLMYFGSIKNKPIKLLKDKIFEDNPKNLGRQRANLRKITNSKITINPPDKITENNVASFDITHLHDHLKAFIYKLCCAIYYYETSEKINKALRHCYSVFVLKKSNSDEALELTEISNAAFTILNIPYKGDNPLVFKYRVINSECLIVIQFTFYESIIISNQFIHQS